MKILHTSDWHIGKQLHTYDLSEDLSLFFDWLVDYIKTEKIDVMLVSGDIFDQANPSQAAEKQYYDLLKALIPTGCKVILTGGNHDSATGLNAPARLLEEFDITIIGGAKANTHEMFVEVEKANKKIVVAAVPFLKDRDIRKAAAGESYATKIQEIKNGIANFFGEINRHYLSNHAPHPFFVMGHLYVQGSQTSESEREIQIGNQAGVEISLFENTPHYVALGHIHKPQVLSSSPHVRYCGSPIALSFSEKKDQKQITIITINENGIETVESVPIPKFRNLITFEGSLADVEAKVKAYAENTQLISLAEVIVNEEKESIERQQAFEKFISSQPNPNLQIVKSRLNFKTKIRGATDAFTVGTNVSDVTPMEMFEKKLELTGGFENTEELKNAFREILQELNL